MPYLGDSQPLPLPLRLTDRLYVERAGVAPYEVQVSELVEMVLDEFARRNAPVTPTGAIVFSRGYLITDRGPILFS